MLFLLFSFRGRIDRSRYWFGMLVVSFGNFVGQLLIQVLSAGAASSAATLEARVQAYMKASALLLPLSIALLWASLAVQWKRLHDRGRPGWLSLAPAFVMVLLLAALVGDVMAGADLLKVVGDATPYLCALMVIALAMFIDLGCLPSEEGPNAYGDGPQGPGAPSPHNPSPTKLDSAQAAIDRAIAQREAGSTAVQKPAARPHRPPVMPEAAAPAAAAREFGRRAAR